MHWLRSKYKAKRGGGCAQRGNQGTQPVSVVHKSSTLDPTCLHPPAHPRPPSYGSSLALLHAQAHADRQKFSCARTPILSLRSYPISYPSPSPPPSTSTHPPFPRFTTAPLCFSSLHLFPGFSLSESTLFLHATLASRGWEGRGETGGGQVTHADLIWNRVNTRFPANVWLGTKTGMVVCGPNEMRIVFDVTVLPGVIVD